MINLNNAYPSNSNAPDGNYPYGSARNVTTSGDNTGTPFIANLQNDIIGLQQFLLNEAAIIPNNTSDNATTSQQFEAMWKIFNLRTLTKNLTANADYTLTAKENLKNIITITDTGTVLTTGRNIIIDSVGRFIVFKNATTKTLTVKTASGLGVPVIAGATTYLINDGTNVNELLGGSRIVGTATFTNSSNNLNLSGIGTIGIEIGDVIEISGSVSNDGLYTAEILTDANNIIFNYEHRGQTKANAPKSFTNETSTANVTIKIYSKAKNATEGLGQGYAGPTSSRAGGVTYTNSTNRAIKVQITVQAVTASSYAFTFNAGGKAYLYNQYAESTSRTITIEHCILPGQTYSLAGLGNASLILWTEIR